MGFETFRNGEMAGGFSSLTKSKKRIPTILLMSIDLELWDSIRYVPAQIALLTYSWNTPPSWHRERHGL